MNQKTVETINKNILSYISLYVVRFAVQKRSPNNFEDIPLITTPLFIPGMIIYATIKRINQKIKKKANASTFDHIFIHPTDRKSRSHVFPPIIKNLSTDCNIMIIARHPDKIEQDYGPNVKITSFQDEMGNIILKDASNAILSSHRSVMDLHKSVDFSLKSYKIFMIYNYTFLEKVKSLIIASLSNNNTKLHTMSPNPYTSMAVDPQDVYYYQFAKKGLFLRNNEINKSLPFYSPVNYLVWGDRWKALMSSQVHQKSEIYSVGSPWYEQIGYDEEEIENKTDILFLGQDGKESTKLVSSLVNNAKNKKINMKIKLHPKDEDGSWYKSKGWDNYIVDLDDIVYAINTSEVVVVDTSTGFIESCVLNTPTIVFDTEDRGLEKLSPAKYVYFADGISDGIQTINDILDENSTDLARGDRVVKTRNVATKISNLVSGNSKRVS
jgi:nuclear transport factor 2 (NTF2) superfamily protein